MFDHKQFLAALPKRPGVYRMFGAEQELLYVGKARSLKDRVSHYFAASNVDPKVQALVQQIAAIEVTVTNSETEALLLEYNLIKAHKPRFNIVLKDDKSFPYIQLCAEHRFPRLAFYRGPRHGNVRYFGPFPNAGAVRDTLNQLQKLFRIRNCRDSFFANRSRPCLQHQIGRCSAPCVGLIPREAYAQDMASAIKVLEGRSEEVTSELQARMEDAAGRVEFEPGGPIRGLRRERDAGARRAQPRYHELLPARRARRAARGARLLRHAVLRQRRASGGAARQPHRGSRRARGSAERARRARGRGAPPAARAGGALGGAHARERHPGAAHALRPAPGHG